MESTSIKYYQSTFKAQIDKSTVEETREITFVIASESIGKDHRNKFSYNWSNWDIDHFNSNPIVGYQHNVYGDNMCLPPNPDDVLGKASAWMDTFEGKRALISKVKFETADINPTADKVFKKINFGSLNASSVGVVPTGKLETKFDKNDKGEIVDYQINFPGQTLVEWSIVNIPADPNALRRSFKSHTLSALSFVSRIVPELSMNDLMKMSVQEVMDIASKRFTGNIEELEETVTKISTGADPNLDKYIERLNKLKNAKS